LYWLLFNLVTFYTIYVIGLYIEKVNSSLKLIEEKKEELNAMIQNLEVIVSKRTAELEEQNEKLKQVAFFNAHKLRGPFCRIQGLFQLQDLVGPDAADYLEIRVKLGGSIEELDLRIREIQQMVNDDKKDVEKSAL
jgi:signal transduction histidine kinase